MKDINLEKTIPIKIMLFHRPGTKLEIKHFKITFNMLTVLLDGNNHFNAELDQNVSFSKVQYFIQEILNESVFCEKEHAEYVMQFLGAYENNLVVLPTLDKDSIITALHRKINSICNENTQVFVLKMCDVDLDLTYTYTCIDDEDKFQSGLPNTIDWMGEHSYWKTPWWDRNDQITWDRAAANEEERQQNQGRNFNGEVLDTHSVFEEIESHMRGMFEEALIQAGVIQPKEGEVIEVDFALKQAKEPKEKWKPTVI